MDIPEMVDRAEAARRLGLSVATLDAWARSGRGPRYVRYSRSCVRYSLSELQRFVEERTRTSTADNGRAA